MIIHKKVNQRKKYIQGRGLVIDKHIKNIHGKGLIDTLISMASGNAKKAALEIKKIGQGFQII